MDPFLHYVRAVGLVETGLSPALAAGFGAVIALDQPLGFSCGDPHTGNGGIVGGRLVKDEFEGQRIDDFHAHSRGIIGHAVVVIRSALEGE